MIGAIVAATATVKAIAATVTNDAANISAVTAAIYC